MIQGKGKDSERAKASDEDEADEAGERAKAREMAAIMAATEVTSVS